MKLKLYYHITDQPRRKELVDDKIQKMKFSGLWDSFNEINFCAHYNYSAYDDLRESMKYDPRVRIIFHPDSVRKFGEQYTNKTLKLETDADVEPSYIFRFHTKGLNWIDKPEWPQVNAYNQLLDHYNIENWKLVIEKLDQGYEAAGIYWVKQPWPHFKGNVWWTTSSYIKKLKLLKMPHENNFQQQILGGGWLVHDAESWIGTANPRAWDLLRQTDIIGDHPDL